MGNSERTSYLTAVSYRLFGRIASRFTAFKRVYRQSGISRLYESYMALTLFASFATFISAFAIGALLHHFLFKLTPFQYLAAVLTFSGIISLSVTTTFIVYPLYRRDQKKKEIDSNLVCTAGYMGVLSAGGISVERIFERVAQVEQHPSIIDLAKRLITNIKMFGLDVVSSLGDVSLHSPSEIFSKLILGVTNTLKTSGDLKGLLVFETERLLHAKREQLKKTLSSLVGLGEIYITAIVIGPIVFIIMITILSIMGNVAFGISPIAQLNLIVFFGIPTLSAIFIIILNAFLPEEE